MISSSSSSRLGAAPGSSLHRQLHTRVRQHASRPALAARQSQQQAPRYLCVSSASPAEHTSHASIKIIGVGGGGGNAINRMMAAGLQVRVVCVPPTARELPRASEPQLAVAHLCLAVPGCR
jgi:glycerol dehydrogenase-like iron-containing ADH family enzyme